MIIAFFNSGSLGLAEIVIALLISLSVVSIFKVVRNEGLSTRDKIVWSLLIWLVPVLGPILYFLLGNKTATAK
jgi:hypothetical protein